MLYLFTFCISIYLQMYSRGADVYNIHAFDAPVADTRHYRNAFLSWQHSRAVQLLLHRYRASVIWNRNNHKTREATVHRLRRPDHAAAAAAMFAGYRRRSRKKRKWDPVGMEIVHVHDSILDSFALPYSSGLVVHDKLITCFPSMPEEKESPE